MYDFSNMDFSGLGLSIDMAQIFANMPAADRAKLIANLPADVRAQLPADATYDQLYSFYNSLTPDALAKMYTPVEEQASTAETVAPETGTQTLPPTTVTAEPIAGIGAAPETGTQTLPPTTVTAEPVSGIGAAPDYLSGINPEDLAGDIYIDGIGNIPLGALSGQAPIDTPPNYKVKPVSGLDPTGLTLQEKDGRKGFNFVTNKAAIAGFVPVIEGATYQLWNERGKNKVWASGTGEEGLRQVYAAAQDLSARDGKKANWGVKVQLPGQTEWIRVVEDDPGKGFVGGALDVLGDAALGALAAVATGGLALPVAALGAGLGAAGSLGGLNVTDIALPVIGAATPLGPIAGAGIGSVGSSLAQGRPLEDALIRGGITAATAGLVDVSGLGDKISGALGSVVKDLGIEAGPALIPGVTGGIGGFTGVTIPQAIGDEILVSGAVSSLPASATAAGIGGGITAEMIADYVANMSSGLNAQDALNQANLEQQFDQAFPQEDIVVTAARNARIDAAAAAIRDGNTVGNEALDGLTDAEFAEAQRRAEIVAPGQVNTGTTPPIAGIGGGAGSVIPETVGTEDIVSEGQKETPTTGPSDLVKDTTKTTDETKADDTTKDGDDGKGLTTKDYIRMALAAPELIKGISGLLGAGESNDRFIAESSPLSYSPLNREQTIAGGSGAAPAFNVFTYGQDLPAAQRGEFQFFKPYDIKAAPQQYTAATTVPIYTQADVDARNAQITSDYNAKAADFNAYQDTLASQVTSGAMTPEAAAAAAQQYAAGLGSSAAAPTLAEGGEVDDDMVKHLVSYSQGGGHKGPGKVKGIGSGQEDLIPAWLSDGEYVWSAQDVADLGDGSTDEGVRRLDKMREMVRKGAGRKQTKKIAKPQPGLDKMLKAVGGPV